jgi:hypothetical protein
MGWGFFVREETVAMSFGGEEEGGVVAMMWKFVFDVCVVLCLGYNYKYWWWVLCCVWC